MIKRYDNAVSVYKWYYFITVMLGILGKKKLFK